MAEPVRFTVITPTHRRRGSLLRMLQALATQDYPFELFEAVVILDGPDGDLALSLRRQRFPFRLRVVEQVRSGPAAARNKGLELAAEPFALFLDDDVLPEPSLMRRHADAHAEPDVVVIGPLLAAQSSRPSPWAAWEWATLKEQYRAMESGEWAPTPRQFYTGNASVRLDHIRSAGGFNTLFRRGEDVELAWRLYERGLRFVFDPLARAEHFAERSFEAWMRAAREYGRTDVMLERIRTGRDLPGWVGREFQERHPYTRTLTRSAVALPGLLPVVGRLGCAGALAAGRLGWRRTANHVCSALFTMAYWQGVRDQLGRSRVLAITRSDSGQSASEPAA